jgi:hypothetical protein
MRKKILISERNLKRMLGRLLFENNIVMSTVEMAPLADSAQLFLTAAQNLKEELKKLEKSSYEDIIKRVKHLDVVFHELMESELSPAYYDAFKSRVNFGAEINRASEKTGSKELVIPLPVSKMAETAGVSIEVFSNALLNAAVAIRPQMSKAFDWEARDLRIILERMIAKSAQPASGEPKSWKETLQALESEKQRFTQTVYDYVIDELANDDIVAGLLDLAMDGEPLPAALPKGLQSELMHYASMTGETKEYEGYKYSDFEGSIRDRFLAYHKKLATKPLNVVIQTTGRNIADLKKFPDFVQRTREALQYSDEDIEKFAKAPPGSPLGRIAFAPERAKREKIPFEPNTEAERDLRDDVWRYAHENEDIDPANVDLIKQLVAQGHYDDAIRFTDPSVGTVYRGMILDADYVDQALPGLSKHLEGLDDGDIITVDLGMIFRARNKSQLSSWSDSAGVATSFAFISERAKSAERVCPIIMHAQISDNPEGFLDALNLFRKIDIKRKALLNEREHFGLGDIRVSKITIGVAKASDDFSLTMMEERMPEAVETASDSPMPAGFKKIVK